jgi:hypothetical protein
MGVFRERRRISGIIIPAVYEHYHLESGEVISYTKSAKVLLARSSNDENKNSPEGETQNQYKELSCRRYRDFQYGGMFEIGAMLVFLCGAVWVLLPVQASPAQ